MRNCFWLLFFFLLPYWLFSDRIEVPPGDYIIQIPVGWTLFDKDDISQVSFLSDDESSILQVSYYGGDQFQSTEEMYETLLSELDPQGDVSTFPYLDWDAWVADLQFSINQINYRGWFILLDGEEMDYQITVFCAQEDYDTNLPWMISALDGFAPGSESLRNPGIISSMMYYGTPQFALSIFQTESEVLQFQFNQALKQESQDYIEREALILYEYRVNEPLFHLAWERYYNLIYKDNYESLRSLYKAWEPLYNSLDREAFIDRVLAWIQSFEYSGSGTFSDLLSPLSAAVEKRGDCDSLGLLYLMIMEYFHIEGVFIVSEEYSHAMAAIESERDGASFTYEGKRYVVAELTDQVAFGQIPSSMADLSKWQIIAFP